MKKYCCIVIFLMIPVVLWTLAIGAMSCSSPEGDKGGEVDSVPALQQQYEALRNEHIALQHAHNTLLGNYDQLKGAKAEWDASVVKYGELEYQHGVLQANYDLVITQYNSMTAYYEELFSAVAPGKDALKVMNEQYQELLDRHDVINGHVALLRAGKVKEVTDNLTAGELEVFNRGVSLWWETFNE